MPIYNLLEYSENYSMRSRSLWKYFSDEVNDAATENDATNNEKNNNKTTRIKSIEYKTKLIGSVPTENSRLYPDFVVPLTYLRNFRKFLALLLINCEVELDLSWSKECIISEISTAPEVGRDNPVNARLTIGTTFLVNNTKLYVPVVTLSINDNIKFFENIKQSFEKNNFL